MTNKIANHHCKVKDGQYFGETSYRELGVLINSTMRKAGSERAARVVINQHEAVIKKLVLTLGAPQAQCARSVRAVRAQCNYLGV